MNANKRSLGQIFDPSIRLVVPLFQRPYVWEQEKNWEPLWESIRDVADRRLAGGTQHPHFLGAVVLDQLNTRTGDIDARQVIDGQQRMTTFQIVLAAARDLCRALGDEPFSLKFATLTGNASSLCVGPDDVFKVWPTNVNRMAFRDVMTAGSIAEICKRFNGKPNAKQVGELEFLPNAYLFFYHTIADWLGPKDAENFAERLRALWQTIKDDMQVVVIDLDENDDAQVIFETLNALGTPLLPADLIKNFLFQSAELRGENTGKLYDRYWKPFDERSDFWRAVVGQGRLKRPRIDQFLQHYLTLMKGDEVPATHLFAEFRLFARRNQTISATDHLRLLHDYGCIFERFFTGYDESSREGQFFYRLGELETTTFFPLLLEVFKTADNQSQQEILTVLVDLESFIVRRMVCGLTTKNYNLLVRSLIQKLRAGDRFSAAAIREFLLSQDAESTRWPSDAEFRSAWVSRPVYDQLTRGRVRIVLEALELALHTSKSEKVKIESNLTIEHVMPQKWSEHWPLPGSVPTDEAKQLRDSLIHTFGNLTLVTGRLNPAMSNSAWITKKTALSEHGAFALNRKLCALATWDEAAIKRRAAELFNLAKTIWPKPVASGAIGEANEQQALDAILKETLSHNEVSQPSGDTMQDLGNGRSIETELADGGGQQRGDVIAHPYMDKGQTIEAFRRLVAELRDDNFVVVRAADPILMHALYYHFGSWSKAHELLDVADATRAEWKAYLDAKAAQSGMRRKEYRERRIEEFQERQKAQRERKTLSEALAMVERNAHYPKCASKDEVALLCLCVLAGVEIINPDDADEVVASDDKHLLVDPLWKKVKSQLGKTARKQEAGITDPGKTAFLNLTDYIRGQSRWPQPSATVRETMCKIAGELGVEIGDGTTEEMAEKLLSHARKANRVERVVELLAHAAVETVAEKLRESSAVFEGFCQKESVATPNLLAEVSGHLGASS